jgi:DNA segregation ATPase FtsK/SpoIIIE, S-DNA-T family
MWDLHRIKSDLIALALFAATLFIGLSMLSFDPGDPPGRLVHPVRDVPLNLCGELGAQLSYGLRAAFGIGAWFVVFALAAFDFRLLSRGPDDAVPQKAVGTSLMLASLCVILHLLVPDIASGQIVGSGGYLGAWGVAAFEEHFATTGLLILLSSCFLAGFVLVADTNVVTRALRCLLRPVVAIPAVLLSMPARLFRRRSTEEVEVEFDHRGALSHRDSVIATDEEDLEDDAAIDEEVDVSTGKPGEIKVNPPVTTALSQRDEVIARLEAASATSNDTPYTLPSLDLLEESEEFPYELLAKRARLAAITLEKTFQEFGLNVKVVEIDTGPVITQFELELEAGLRLSKVTSLADDLAIALRVPSVRVVAPIPGKNTVGVEVPNDKRVMVRLRDLIESCAKDIDDKRIPLFLGKDVSGRPLAVDMAKMPHLLIAGRTGTGKSVCLNALILSILMTRTPEQVRMLMIDPKMVELSPYKRIPHLMHPVITDMKKAEAVLGWAVEKMEERYDLLARTGVRHLDSYNKLNQETRLERMGIDPESEEAEQIPEKMPYIVIIADEMADMMMTSGKDVEAHIIRLAQKSRAVGIHLILATQKPTVDVITGLIKSNLPARVAFQVASKSDSRVVLDEGGADKLLGNGDMLFLAPGTSNLSRAQGAFVSDEEVNSVIDYFAGFEPDYSAELAQLSASGGMASRDQMKERDELYEQAIDVIVREGRGSVSLLQRALGVGYGRGARLIDFMAEDGIVGDYNGSQAREVLFTPEQWAEFQMAGGAHLEDEPAFA